MVSCKCGHKKSGHYKMRGKYFECITVIGDKQGIEYCPCGKYEEGEVKKPSIYILNTPILTEYGEYSFKKISIEDVVEKMGHGFTSAVGHEGTANLMSHLTGMPVPVNRVVIKMQSGDIAIVFRVLIRLPEGKVLTQEELLQVSYEFGLLERIR